MALHDDALVEALAGAGGAAPSPGVLHVVAVPRFDPGLTSLRAAVVVAGADVVRVPVELPPDVLGPLVRGERVAGSLRALEPGGINALVAEERVVVQLVATAVQTAPATVEDVTRLRAAGVRVEVVASTGEVDAALVAAGLGTGLARTPDDGRLDLAVLVADRPDLRAWRDGLSRRGRLGHTPVVLVDRAGTPQQTERRTTLAGLADLDAPRGPTMLVVGDDVVGPEAWRADLPLRGVVVTNHRAGHQAPALSARLRSLGAAVVEAPLLEIAPGDVDAMVAAVRDCAAGVYDLLCLTSPNGARALATAVDEAGLDARALAGLSRIACVGPGTAATLEEVLAVRADVIAEVSTTEGLADTLGAPDRAGATALLTRADLATPTLRDRLVDAGWAVTEVTAYRTVTEELPDAVAEAMADGRVDLVPVLSSSMASALVAAGRERGIAAGIVSIGPVTTATLREHGVTPAAEADPHDLDGLVAALASLGPGTGG